jgi:uncharacterized protein YutE (UPF0331/DUF86 family)
MSQLENTLQALCEPVTLDAPMQTERVEYLLLVAVTLTIITCALICAKGKL